MTIARECSFTRAAAQLGLRLLTRTTRSVVPTEAGDRLVASVGPRLEEIDAELDALTALRDKPAGVVRLTATEHAAQSILLPAIEKLQPDYPDIRIEITPDIGLTDIVTERFDAGVRPGGIIAKDMIAMPIGPPLRMAAAPAYFESRRFDGLCGIVTSTADHRRSPLPRTETGSSDLHRRHPGRLMTGQFR